MFLEIINNSNSSMDTVLELGSLLVKNPAVISYQGLPRIVEQDDQIASPLEDPIILDSLREFFKENLSPQESNPSALPEEKPPSGLTSFRRRFAVRPESGRKAFFFRIGLFRRRGFSSLRNIYKTGQGNISKDMNPPFSGEKGKRKFEE